MDARTVADQVIEQLDAKVVTAIRTDPRGGAKELGLTVEALDLVPTRGSGGWCDGASFVDEGRIMYRPTAGLRENFTICHELGHHLLRLNDDAMDWVHEHDNADEALEELCDKFAAAVLVPHQLTTEVISTHGFTAEAVIALYNDTNASRHCCAIAIADQLPTKGFIAIVNPATEKVWAAAKKAETSPTAYHGQPVPAAHSLRRLSAEHPWIRTKSWWPLGENDRWNYYLDAIRYGHWNIGVFTERDLWDVEKLHFSQPERIRYDGDVTCQCGFSGDTPWFPCNECNTPPCPRCRKCTCDWRAERETRTACQNCFQSVRTHLLIDGLCDGCR